VKRLGSVFLAVLALCAANAAAASAALGELTFVEPEKISVTYGGERSDEVSVWLENDGAQAVTPEFTTVIEDSDGEPASASVEALGTSSKAGKPTPVAAGHVERYRLAFLDPSESSGQLVAGGAGVEPASVPLSIGPDLPSTRGIDAALLIPLGLAVAYLVIAWLFGLRAKKPPLKLRGVAELDFSKSFASTLTAVGALLGTIIAAGVLPEETVNLSRGGFVGLNLTFGVAIVIAAAVAGSFLSPRSIKNKDKKTEWKVEGYVWSFGLAALITLWAVLGELYTIFLLVGELGSEEGFSSLGVTMLRVVLIVGALALIPYTAIKVKVAVEAPPEPRGDSAAGEAGIAEAVLPRAFTIDVPTAEVHDGRIIAVEVSTAPGSAPPASAPTAEEPSQPVQLL
jgi:hypothetical protein